jgi:enoyl-CoA hydratase/carnithine racemase
MCLTFSAPGGNALLPGLIEALRDGFAEARRANPQFLLVRSASEKIFCAGANLDHIRTIIQDPSPQKALADFIKDLQGLLNEIEDLPFLTVCDVVGPAFGGGLEMALAFDLRVARPKARFALPEVKLGLLPAAGGTHRLERAIGGGDARRVLLTGDELTSAAAYNIGLVDYLASDDADVDTLLARFAELSTAAITQIKSCRKTDTRQNDQRESDAIIQLVTNPDTQSRIAAFLMGR